LRQQQQRVSTGDQCSAHLRFEAREDVTTAPALAVGDKPSMATAHELRGDILYTPSSGVSLLAPGPGLSTNTEQCTRNVYFPG